MTLFAAAMRMEVEAAKEAIKDGRQARDHFEWMIFQEARRQTHLSPQFLAGQKP